MGKNKQRNLFFAGLAAMTIGFWMAFVVGETTQGLIMGALGVLLIVMRFGHGKN